MGIIRKIAIGLVIVALVVSVGYRFVIAFTPAWLDTVLLIFVVSTILLCLLVRRRGYKGDWPDKNPRSDA